MIYSGILLCYIFSLFKFTLHFSLLSLFSPPSKEWKDTPPAKQKMGDIFVEMTSYTKVFLPLFSLSLSLPLFLFLSSLLLSFFTIFFQVYISYVTNYETAEQRCLQLKKKNDKFEKWEQETLASVPGGFPTLSFLLVCFFFFFIYIYIYIYILIFSNIHSAIFNIYYYSIIIYLLFFLQVTPVQRIPRYLMLVDSLLKATWEGHEDREPLGVALKSIK